MRISFTTIKTFLSVHKIVASITVACVATAMVATGICTVSNNKDNSTLETENYSVTMTIFESNDTAFSIEESTFELKPPESSSVTTDEGTSEAEDSTSEETTADTSETVAETEPQEETTEQIVTEPETEAPVTEVETEPETEGAWTVPEYAQPEDQTPDYIPETLPISDFNYDQSALPDLGGVMTPEEKEEIANERACCKYCGESHSLYAVHAIFDLVCYHCGADVPTGTCHDCVRDGGKPAW